MVTDRLENLGSYSGLLPGLREVCRFFNRRRPRGLCQGRHELKGKATYIVVARSPGRSLKQARLEAHRKYADVHLLVGGSESIGWRLPASGMKVLRRYDSKADIEEFSDRPDMWLKLRPGWFAIFMPGEPHAPLVSEGVIRKLVVKIKCGSRRRRSVASKIRFSWSAPKRR